MKRPFQRIAGRLRDEFVDGGVSQVSVFDETALIGGHRAQHVSAAQGSAENDPSAERGTSDDLLRQARCASTEELGALAPRLVAINDDVVSDVLVRHLRKWRQNGGRELVQTNAVSDAVLAIAVALVRRGEHFEEASSIIAMALGGTPLWRLAGAHAVASILAHPAVDHASFDLLLKPALLELWERSPDTAILQALAPAFFSEPAVVIARCAPLLRDEQFHNRQSAISILSELASQRNCVEAKAALAAHVIGEDSVVLRVRAAAAALEQLDSQALIAVTQRALSAEAPSIRLRALALIGALPGDARAQLVRQALQDEPDPCLRHCMRQVMRPQ